MKYITLSVFLFCMLGMHAQTTVKIAFKQPEHFRVTPKSVSLDMQGNHSLELGNEVTVTGGSAPYSYTWKADDAELSESPIFQVYTSGTYLLEVSDKNNCICSVLYEVSGGTSIKTPEDDLLKIFPNPTAGIVYIASSQSEKIRNLYITSTIGKTYFRQKESINNPFQYKIDIRHLPDGVYYITIQLDNRVITKTVILKK